MDIRRPDYSEVGEQSGLLEVVVRSSGTVANETHPQRNEDALFVGQAAFVVCDGVGEFEKSEGSRAAAETVGEMLDERGSACSAVEAAEDLMREALASGHEAAKLHESPTTATAALFWRDIDITYLTVGNVGDSEAFMLRNEQLSILSWPDGEIYGTEQIIKRAGMDSRDVDELSHILEAIKELPDWMTDKREIAANYFRRRHMIMQALGEKSPPEPVVNSFKIQSGDIIVLLTDGIIDPLITSQIQEIITSGGGADELIATASAGPWPKRAKADDRTAIVIDCN